MPPPSPLQAKLISNKLETLEQMKTHLSGVLDTFVTQAVASGRFWLKNQDVDGGKMTFSELNQLLERAASQMFGAEQSLSSPTGDTSETVAAASFIQQGQLTNVAQEEVNTQPVMKQETAPEDMKKVLARIEVLEEAVSSLRSSTDKVTKQQTVLDTNFSDLSKKQRAFEDQGSKHMEQIDKTLKKQTTKKSEMKEIKDKLSEQGGKLITLSSQQSDIMKQVGKKWTEYDGKLSDVSNERQEVGARLDDLDSRLGKERSELTEQSAKLRQEMNDMLKNKLSEIDGNWAQLSTSNADLGTKLESLKKSSDDMETKLTQTITKVSNKTDAISSTTNELTKKQKAQLKALKKQRNSDLNDYKLKFEMVCQIVADRMSPMERLREILNKKIEAKNQNVDTLHSLEKKVTQLTTKLKQLDQVDNQVTKLKADVKELGASIVSSVGFRALISLDTVSKVGQLLCGYYATSCNKGNHFDCTTGVFTAPTEGICTVALSILQSGEGMVHCEVIHERSYRRDRENERDALFGAVTSAPGASDNDNGVCNLRKGDKLFVVITKQYNDAKIDCAIFNCLMVC